MPSYPMGPLTVSHDNTRYRSFDIEIVEFPARVSGVDVQILTFDMRTWAAAKRIKAVEFPTSDTAELHLANGVVIEIAYVPVTEPDRRGHHVVVRTSGGARHDLGVDNVHFAWRHTAMICNAIMRYQLWDEQTTRAAFNQQFTEQIRERLIELAGRDDLSSHSWARCIQRGNCEVSVYLHGDLSGCTVYVQSVYEAETYNIGNTYWIRETIRDLMQAEGVPNVDVH